MKKETGFAITSKKGFHMTFENGYTVSVQFGPGNYCDNYNMDFMQFHKGNLEVLESSDAEIAAWDKDGNWVKIDGDGVKGYCSPKEVLEFINMIANK